MDMKIIEKISQSQKDIGGAKPVTIACIGDSVTQGCFECYTVDKEGIGTVFDSASGYPTRIKEMLALLYPSVPVQIINAGINGDNAVNGTKRIDRDVLAYAPDLVIIGFALNDSTGGEEGLAAYKSALEEMVQKVLQSGAECILLTPNMMNVDTSPHIKDELFIRLSKWFGDIQKSGVLGKYAQTEREVATAFNVRVCDMYESWRRMQLGGVNVTELLSNKLNHPVRQLHYYTAIKLIETMFL